MHLVLFEPEIPPNTGNVARLCAAMRVDLHLVEPLGFSLADRYLKRAGLDYWPHVRLKVWADLAAYLAADGRDKRLVASSSREGESVQHFPFSRDDALLLGPETRGLPREALDLAARRVRIPISGCVRSLNLSTAAGILLFQAMNVSGLLAERMAGGFPDERIASEVRVERIASEVRVERIASEVQGERIASEVQGERIASEASVERVADGFAETLLSREKH